MLKIVSASVLTGVAGLSTAATINQSVTGIEFYDAAGDGINAQLMVLVGAGANITSISWNVTLTTYGLSWASEAGMRFDNQDSLNPFMTDVFVGAGVDSPVFQRNFVGSVLTPGFVVGPGGYVNIEFFESFDDADGLADAVFDSGVLPLDAGVIVSTITLSGTGFVPSPGPIGVMGVGGLWIAGRRQRR